MAYQAFLQPTNMVEETTEMEAGKYVPRIEYFASEEYQSLKGWKKMKELWKDIMASRQLSKELAEIKWAQFTETFTHDGNVSFDFVSDALPLDRPKTQHTQGLVAKAKWVPVENKLGFTGIFEKGHTHVLIRVSETQNRITSGSNAAVALKFLIDGKPSENILAMYRIGGNNGDNFFKKRLSNRIKPFEMGSCEGKTLHRKLIEATPCPYTLGIGQIGDKFQNGQTIDPEDVNIPQELYFFSPFEQLFYDQYMEMPWHEAFLDAIHKGDTVYEVRIGNVPIANIVLTSEFYISPFGDEHLFFQHVRGEDDTKYWAKNVSKKWNHELNCFNRHVPDKFWGNEAPGWPKFDKQAKEKYYDLTDNGGCPFAWLLNKDWMQGTQSEASRFT